MRQTLVLVVIQLIGLCTSNPVIETECPEPGTFRFSNGSCYTPTTVGPCKNGEWLIVRENGNIFCEPNPCIHTDQVWFHGACTFIFNASACPSVGERLFVDKHGDAVCDCDEGWARGPDGKCFQEFTRGFCQEDTILRIKKKRCQAQTLDLDFQECIFPFIHKILSILAVPRKIGHNNLARR